MLGDGVLEEVKTAVDVIEMGVRDKGGECGDGREEFGDGETNWAVQQKEKGGKRPGRVWRRMRACNGRRCGGHGDRGGSTKGGVRRRPGWSWSESSGWSGGFGGKVNECAGWGLEGAGWRWGFEGLRPDTREGAGKNALGGLGSRRKACANRARSCGGRVFFFV